MKPSRHPDSTGRYGRVMIIAGWLMALALLTLFFSGWLEQQRNPNRHLANIAPGAQSETLLQRNRYGQYLATGSINGQPVEFLVDTGASDVSIPTAIASQLGLERGPARVYQTANGTITAYQTAIPQLQLGGIELRGVRASINPHMEGETVLLGMSFLKHLEFTQRGSTLMLRQYK